MMQTMDIYALRTSVAHRRTAADLMHQAADHLASAGDERRAADLRSAAAAVNVVADLDMTVADGQAARTARTA